MFKSRLIATLAAALAFAALPAAASAADVSPVSTVDVSGSPPIVVNDGPGDQADSHVSGNLVSYTNFSGSTPEIRYRDLGTAADAAIPNGGDFDIVSALRGSTIVYTHAGGGPGQRIFQFDASDPGTPPHELDPQPNALRENSSVGDQLVAWEDFGFDPSAQEIVVYDRATDTAERLTNDAQADTNPAVSPTGAALTWTKCASVGVSCDVWSASRSGATWTQRQLTSDGADEMPGTDGSIAAYDSSRTGNEDIYWQPLGGGTESHLVMGGDNRNANVSGGVISFEHRGADAQWDVYAFDTSTGVLYKVAGSPGDEVLSDTSVTGSTATVTWSVQEGTSGYNVYARTFSLHRPPHLTANHAQVEVNEGSQAANGGSVSDPDGDAVSLSASVGHVTNNGDGTWSWSYTPDDGPSGSQTVTITGTDPDGLMGTTSFQLTVDNVAPTAGFNAPASATPGSSFTISLTGPSDPSSADTSASFSYAFDCGTGTFSPFSSSSSASCLATTGSMTVRGRIQDKDGGVSTYSATVQVAAPGSPIVFTSTRDGNSEIYSMHADGSGVTRLTHNSAIDGNPAWSPDHSRVAFLSTRDGNSEIYTMNADGSGVKRLTNNRAIDVTPSWSPGGAKIAFASDRGGDFDIYTMNAADGSGVTRLTTSHALDATPDWSPDGTRIAFTSAKDGNVEIYAMNANGSGLTRLTNNKAIDATPSWSPDGTRIVFSTDRDGNFELYSITASGGGLTRLTNNHVSDITPAWSASGKIVFSTDRDHNLEIYSMNTDGSGATRLTNNPALDTLPDA